MIAIGIGLHNMGEGLAIGSAYALGALALGRLPGDRLRDPQHDRGPGDRRAARAGQGDPDAAACSLLGLIAGAPAILGAVIGASVYNQELATFLLGIGVGAIVQVIVQLTPAIRDSDGRALHPLSVAGILAGVAVMYTTGLLVSI